MKRMLFTCIVLLVFAGTAHATLYSYSGSLLQTDGTLITSSTWEGASLSWIVSQETASAPWVYNYTFSSSSPNISHGIFEVSSTFDSDNILTGTSPYDEIKTYTSGPSNPGIPGSVYGIKFNVDSGSFTIVSDREPMWGDFYGKGGSADYAYNLQFGNDTLAPIGSGNAGGWALVPDTHPVPEPSTMLLLGLGVMGVAAAGRRKRSNKA